MRSFFAVALTAAAMVAAQLRIETPTNLAVCQPALLMWAGGSPPYFPAVIPGGQPGAASLKDFPQTSDTKYTWTVDLPAGQEISLRITDSTGAINYSEKVTIRAGSNTNCLSGNSTAAASGSASSAGGAAVGAASSGAASGMSRASAAVGSATSAAGSMTSAAGASASSAGGAARSAVSGASASGASAVGAANSAAASAARSSGAALPASKAQLAGVLGAVAGVFGVAMF